MRHKRFRKRRRASRGVRWWEADPGISARDDKARAVGPLAEIRVCVRREGADGVWEGTWLVCCEPGKASTSSRRYWHQGALALSAASEL